MLIPLPKGLSYSFFGSQLTHSFLKKTVLSIPQCPVLAPIIVSSSCLPTVCVLSSLPEIPERQHGILYIPVSLVTQHSEQLNGPVRYSHLTPILLHLFSPTAQFPALSEHMPGTNKPSPLDYCFSSFMTTAISPQMVAKPWCSCVFLVSEEENNKGQI